MDSRKRLKKSERLSSKQRDNGILRSSYDVAYLHLPKIYVKDMQTGNIHAVGTNQHDRLYLDEEGHIQYENLQCCSGTKFGDYEFVLDDQGHNAKNLPFSKDEISKYGLNYSDAWFASVDLEDYAAEEYIKRFRETSDREMKLITRVLELEEELNQYRKVE